MEKTVILSGVLEPDTLQDIVVDAISRLIPAEKRKVETCACKLEFFLKDGQLACRYEIVDDPEPLHAVLRAWLQGRTVTVDNVQQEVQAATEHLWETLKVLAPETVLECVLNYSGLAEQYKKPEPT